MYLSFQKFLAALLFPIAIVVCLAVLVISSLLWIPYIIISAIDKLLWWLFEKELYEGIRTFEEFIFSCYGFAAVMIYLPLTAFDEKLY